MFVGVFKNKINNSEHYIYLDNIDGKLSYHGVTLCGGNAYTLDKNVLNQIYSEFKIDDNCKYIKDYKEYKVYYDDKNNLTHYMKDGKEDFLMLFLKNGKSAELYKNKFFPPISKNKLYYSILATETAILLGSVPLLCGLLASSPYIGSKFSTEFKTEISYAQDKLSGNELDVVTPDDAINMINSSTRLTQEEKDFLCNYKLLSDVLPYYENTNMEYVINARLDDFGIIYEEFNDNASGKYCYSNEMYLAENIKNATDEYKKDVESHEFVHALQANCLIYIKEASAEVIASEYFNNEKDSYDEACYNLQLLTETLGPKVMWNYIFSGDDKEFIELLKNNLNNDDYNQLIKEFIKSPFDGNPDHNLITELIHKLYKNIYNEDIKNNHDIYDFYGNYIEKNCFIPSEYEFSKIIYCDSDRAIESGIAHYESLYKYQKEISLNEFSEFIMDNNSLFVYFDNCFISGLSLESKDSNTQVESCNLIDGKVIVYTENGSEIYELIQHDLSKLAEKYNLYYYIKTTNENDIKDSEMKLVEADPLLISNDERYKAIGFQLEYKARNIQDRFPNQVIRINEKVKEK